MNIIFQMSLKRLNILENAMIRARHASQFTDLPVFSDDSGLEIDALNGRPGIYSARYNITNDFNANMARVMTELKQVPPALRTARFRIVVVYLRHQNDPKPICIDASWEGSIVMDTYPKTPGFGYDPIFWVPEHQKTASELPKEQAIAPRSSTRIIGRSIRLKQVQVRLLHWDQ